MDGERTTAVVAMAVSVIGTGFSGWQARIAKKSADLAGGQARSAEAQARAAEAQVALMRQQLEEERGARHEARGPNFTASYVSALHIPDVDPQKVAVIQLTQNEGPGLTAVQISASGDHVSGLLPPRVHFGTGQPDVELGPVAPGGTTEVRVALEDFGSTAVTFSLCCSDEDGAVWRRACACNVPAGTGADA